MTGGMMDRQQLLDDLRRYAGELGRAEANTRRLRRRFHDKAEAALLGASSPAEVLASMEEPFRAIKAAVRTEEEVRSCYLCLLECAIGTETSPAPHVHKAYVYDRGNMVRYEIRDWLCRNPHCIALPYRATRVEDLRLRPLPPMGRLGWTGR